MDYDKAPKNFLRDLFMAHALKSDHKWDNFELYGQPEIRAALFNNRGGYAYIIFENNTDSINMQATVEFLGSENIKIMEPYSGMRPTLSIKPKEKILIPILATKIPYKIWYRIISAFKDKDFRKNLKEMVRKSSIQVFKSYKGKKVDIVCYYLYHAEGFAILYTNNTKEYVLTEKVEFKLNNCHIESVYGNYIEVIVKPGEENLV